MLMRGVKFNFRSASTVSEVELMTVDCLTVSETVNKVGPVAQSFPQPQAKPKVYS